LAGQDDSIARAELARAQISYLRLTEPELAFTREEIAEYLVLIGGDVTRADEVRIRSGGFPLWVTTVASRGERAAASADAGDQNGGGLSEQNGLSEQPVPGSVSPLPPQPAKGEGQLTPVRSQRSVHQEIIGADGVPVDTHWSVIGNPAPSSYTRFLSTLSAVPVFNIALARTLCDDPNVTDHIARLLDGVFGTWHGETGIGAVFVWRPAVRATLRRVLPLPDAVRDEVRRHAIDWYLAAGRVTEAFECALETGDPNLVEQIAWQNFTTLVEAPPQSLLRGLSRARPLIAEQPTVMLLSALARRTESGPTPRVHHMLIRSSAAFAHIADHDPNPERRLFAATVRGIALQVDGALRSASVAATEAVRRGQELALAGGVTDAPAFASYCLWAGRVLARAEEYELAIQSLLFGIDYVEWGSPSYDELVRALGMLGYLTANADILRHPAFSAQIHAEVPYEQRSLIPETARVHHHIARTWWALDRGDLSGAAAECAALLPQLSVVEQWPVVVHTLAVVQLFSGQSREAKAALDSYAGAVARSQRELPSSDSTHMAIALCTLEMGDAAGARQSVEMMQPASAMSSVTRSLILLALGDNDAAWRALDDGKFAVSMARFEQLRLLLLAVISLRQNRTEAALTHLTAAAARRAMLRTDLAIMLVPDADRAALRALADEHGHDEISALFDDLAHVHSPVPALGERPVLSERELRVLNLAKFGLSNAKIAAELFVSANTVKTQLGSVYAKLGVPGRAEAVTEAIRLRLIGD
ncbi:MAG: helix-turn-helix domain-containing protein, partial [Mycetocola sp.]